MGYGEKPFESINEFVDKFSFRDGDVTEEVVDYRMSLLTEELQETQGAHLTGNVEELIDGHIDVIIVAMGNLAIFGVDGKKAFDEVMRANMSKVLGKRRPTDPDGKSIMKPDGWVGPDHSDNHGALNEVYGTGEAAPPSAS
jgi:predicted HAD superfamily Cof-like phosphohydrolase